MSDIDLELRIGTTKMILTDLDNTSKHDNGVYRYNTLAHYKVENKATLALIPRQSSSSYNISMLSERTDKSSFSLIHNNSPTLSRQPFGTNGSKHSDPCSTLKVYHLVKTAAEHGMNHDSQVEGVSMLFNGFLGKNGDRNLLDSSTDDEGNVAKIHRRHVGGRFLDVESSLGPSSVHQIHVRLLG